MQEGDNGLMVGLGWHRRALGAARGIPLDKAIHFCLMAAMFGGLCYAKLRYNPALDRDCWDGCYYYQIARNVAEGNGFSSNVSLYNLGLRSFPHHVVHSPLWPLIMAVFAPVIPLRLVAMMLPEVLYLATLLLLHILVGRLTERMGSGYEARYLIRRWQWLHVADVVTLAFATNFVFFHHTSTPHTESAAFFLLFATLLMVDVAALRRSLVWAAVAGVLAGLTVMTRYQFIGALVAIPVALLASSLRVGGWKMAITALTGSIAVFVPWVVYLNSWMESGPSLGQMVGLSRLGRQTPAVPEFVHRIPHDDVWSYVVTRFRGVWIALNPLSEISYYHSHRWTTYVIPIAIFRFLSQRQEWPGALRLPSRTTGAVVTAMVLTGVFAVGPLHDVHRAGFREWLFGWRHGLPLVLLTSVCIAYLVVRASTYYRALVIVLLLLSVQLGLIDIAARTQAPFPPSEWVPTGIDQAERQLLRWLDNHSQRPAVISTNARELAMHSRAGFHTIERRTPLSTIIGLLEHAGADYVLRYPRDAPVAVLGRQSRLQLLTTFGTTSSRIEVYGLRE